MKLIYACDLHGDIYLYDDLKMLIAREENANALLLGGDLFAHTRRVSDQLRFVDSYFTKFAREIKLDILYVPGNNDWPSAMKYLEQLELPNIILQLERRSYPYQSLKVSGYSMVPPTPFRRKDYEARDLEKDLVTPQEDAYISSTTGLISPIAQDYFTQKESMEEDLKSIDPQSNIWVCHSPPYGGSLDLGWGRHHLGSKALTQKIQELQPQLTLHGHIHEAPLLSGNWVDRIGKTYCINPGRSEQQVHAVIIELDELGILNSLKHSVYGSYRL